MEIVKQYEGGKLYLANGIRIVDIRGDWFTMGRQYGCLAKENLQHVLDFLKEKTIEETKSQRDEETKRQRDEETKSQRDEESKRRRDGESKSQRVEETKKGGSEKGKWERVVETAEKLFSRYPEELRAFFRGMAETSGLSEEELRIVNAVEYAEPAFMCSALAAWGPYSTDQELVFGRNYDAMSYLPIKDDLLVTVYHPEGMLSALTVGYAGEIYCVNGFNEKGLFIELNNGMPSAGFDIRYDLNASTTELLMLLFRAENMQDVDRFFRETQSFSSIIIGVADENEARSYEWCTAGTKLAEQSAEGQMMQTNHYVHPDWPYDEPNDAQSWFTLTRRKNVCQMAERFKGQIDADRMCTIMQTPMADGGPMFVPFTLYQLVVEPRKKQMRMRITEGPDWTTIDMNKLL